MSYADSFAQEPWISLGTAGELSHAMKMRATNIDPFVRLDLARWGNVPKEIEAVFAIDEDSTVREALAINLSKRQDSSLFSLLTLDRSAAVRAAIASNQATPRTIVMVLAEDVNRDVRQAATDNLIRTSGSKLIRYEVSGATLKTSAWQEWQDSNSGHLACVKKMDVVAQWEHRGTCPICREGTTVISLSTNNVAA